MKIDPLVWILTFLFWCASSCIQMFVGIWAYANVNAFEGPRLMWGGVFLIDSPRYISRKTLASCFQRFPTFHLPHAGIAGGHHTHLAFMWALGIQTGSHACALLNEPLSPSLNICLCDISYLVLLSVFIPSAKYKWSKKMLLTIRALFINNNMVSDTQGE